MITLSHVTKHFGGRVAVADLTLTVPRGEIFGLLGHNGAGKSTAIGVMLGQVWPTSGEVRICGHDVATQRAQALRAVGAIFETPAFYEFLSGWRNLEIFSHYTARTSQRRIAEVVDWVGLTGRERSLVRTYSHGCGRGWHWRRRSCRNRNCFSSMSRAAASIPKASPKCARPSRGCDGSWG
jgi:ABC-2 type transport system ATP-binding protein